MKRMNALVTIEQHAFMVKRKKETLESFELSIRQGLVLLMAQDKRERNRK